MQRWRRDGLPPSLKGIGSLRSRCARWPRADLLDATMLHEFLHALVEHEAGAAAPLWLREGLVETWSEADDAEPATATTAAPALKIDAIDAALAHASTEAESEAAHRAAGWYAARLLDRYGRAKVLAWLRSGIPAGVVATLGQR